MLVTGATGFVGSHVVPALRAGGNRVRVFVRDDARVPTEWRGDVEVVRAGGLEAGAALARAVAGCDVVVHLAGRAHVLRERATTEAERAFEEVNVEGTRTIARAAVAAGVRLVVHASSVGAVATTAGVPVADSTVPAPDTAYGRSKLAAERALREAIGGTGTAAVSLRPPMMYGPRMRGNPLRLFALVARGIPLPVAGVRNRRSMLYVENFAQLVRAVVARGWEGAHEYLVADGPAVATADFARRVGVALGRSALVVPVPGPVLRCVGRAGTLIQRVAPFPIDATAVERFTGSLVIDDARLRALLGPVPTVPFDEALARTATWYRHVDRARAP